eukprot:scpid12620/ scgid6163/ 
MDGESERYQSGDFRNRYSSRYEYFDRGILAAPHTMTPPEHRHTRPRLHVEPPPAAPFFPPPPWPPVATCARPPWDGSSYPHLPFTALHRPALNMVPAAESGGSWPHWDNTKGAPPPPHRPPWPRVASNLGPGMTQRAGQLRSNGGGSGSTAVRTTGSSVSSLESSHSSVRQIPLSVRDSQCRPCDPRNIQAIQCQYRDISLPLPQFATPTTQMSATAKVKSWLMQYGAEAATPPLAHGPPATMPLALPVSAVVPPPETLPSQPPIPGSVPLRIEHTPCRGPGLDLSLTELCDQYLLSPCRDIMHVFEEDTERSSGEERFVPRVIADFSSDDDMFHPITPSSSSFTSSMDDGGSVQVASDADIVFLSSTGRLTRQRVKLERNRSPGLDMETTLGNLSGIQLVGPEPEPEPSHDDALPAPTDAVQPAEHGVADVSPSSDQDFATLSREISSHAPVPDELSRALASSPLSILPSFAGSPTVAPADNTDTGKCTVGESACADADITDASNDVTYSRNDVIPPSHDVNLPSISVAAKGNCHGSVSPGGEAAVGTTSISDTRRDSGSESPRLQQSTAVADKSVISTQAASQATAECPVMTRNPSRDHTHLSSSADGRNSLHCSTTETSADCAKTKIRRRSRAPTADDSGSARMNSDMDAVPVRSIPLISGGVGGSLAQVTSDAADDRAVHAVSVSTASDSTAPSRQSEDAHKHTASVVVASKACGSSSTQTGMDSTDTDSLPWCSRQVLSATLTSLEEQAGFRCEFCNAHVGKCPQLYRHYVEHRAHADFSSWLLDRYNIHVASAFDYGQKPDKEGHGSTALLSSYPDWMAQGLLRVALSHLGVCFQCAVCGELHHTADDLVAHFQQLQTDDCHLDAVHQALKRKRTDQHQGKSPGQTPAFQARWIREEMATLLKALCKVEKGKSPRKKHGRIRQRQARSECVFMRGGLVHLTRSNSSSNSSDMLTGNGSTSDLPQTSQSTNLCARDAIKDAEGCKSRRPYAPAPQKYSAAQQDATTPNETQNESIHDPVNGPVRTQVMTDSGLSQPESARMPPLLKGGIVCMEAELMSNCDLPTKRNSNKNSCSVSPKACLTSNTVASSPKVSKADNNFPSKSSAGSPDPVQTHVCLDAEVGPCSESGMRCSAALTAVVADTQPPTCVASSNPQPVSLGLANASNGSHKDTADDLDVSMAESDSSECSPLETPQGNIDAGMLPDTPGQDFATSPSLANAITKSNTATIADSGSDAKDTTEDELPSFLKLRPVCPVCSKQFSTASKFYRHICRAGPKQDGHDRWLLEEYEVDLFDDCILPKTYRSVCSWRDLPSFIVKCLQKQEERSQQAGATVCDEVNAAWSQRKRKRGGSKSSKRHSTSSITSPATLNAVGAEKKKKRPRSPATLGTPQPSPPPPPSPKLHLGTPADRDDAALATDHCRHAGSAACCSPELATQADPHVLALLPPLIKKSVDEIAASWPINNGMSSNSQQDIDSVNKPMPTETPREHDVGLCASNDDGDDGDDGDDDGKGSSLADGPCITSDSLPEQAEVTSVCSATDNLVPSLPSTPPMLLADFFSLIQETTDGTGINVAWSGTAFHDAKTCVDTTHLTKVIVVRNDICSIDSFTLWLPMERYMTDLSVPY